MGPRFLRYLLGHGDLWRRAGRNQVSHHLMTKRGRKGPAKSFWLGEMSEMKSWPQLPSQNSNETHLPGHREEHWGIDDIHMCNCLHVKAASLQGSLQLIRDLSWGEVSKTHVLHVIDLDISQQFSLFLTFLCDPQIFVLENGVAPGSNRSWRKVPSFPGVEAASMPNRNWGAIHRSKDTGSDFDEFGIYFQLLRKVDLCGPIYQAALLMSHIIYSVGGSPCGNLLPFGYCSIFIIAHPNEQPQCLLLVWPQTWRSFFETSFLDFGHCQSGLMEGHRRHLVTGDAKSCNPGWRGGSLVSCAEPGQQRTGTGDKWW